MTVERSSRLHVGTWINKGKYLKETPCDHQGLSDINILNITASTN